MSHCGDADFDILGLSAADYPELPEVEDEYAVSMQQKVLRSMIEEMAFAVSTNESRPVHTGALFEISGYGPQHGGGGRLPSGLPPGEAGKAGGRRVLLRLPRLRPQRGEEYLRRYGGSG
ncbi:MAG: hypothetical protein ACLU38_02475 [Dysosmobacter sp.]